MSYKYTFNNDHDYLIHFNKNHSKANGQFVSGDGDDDGIIDDHHHYSQNKTGATSGSNVEATTKKKGVFSDSGRGRALKRGVIATGIVVGVTVGLNVVNRLMADKASSYSSYESSGSSWYKASSSGDFGFDNIKDRAAKAKYAGGDW